MATRTTTFGTPAAGFGTPRQSGGLAGPVDFLSAVKARFLADPLARVVTGGIFLQAAGRTAQTPYVIVDENGASTKLVTSTSVIHDTRVRFRVYGGTDDRAAELGDALEDLFTDCVLDFENGWATRWVRGDRRMLLDRGLSQEGAEVWFLQIEFLTRVKR